jgi:hypothetical protein
MSIYIPVENNFGDRKKIDGKNMRPKMNSHFTVVHDVSLNPAVKPSCYCVVFLLNTNGSL